MSEDGAGMSRVVVWVRVSRWRCPKTIQALPTPSRVDVWMGMVGVEKRRVVWYVVAWKKRYIKP